MISDFSTILSLSNVIAVPFGILDARHALDGLSCIDSLHCFAMDLISDLSSPNSKTGLLTPYSLNALIPGLNSFRSSVFVPSTTSLTPNLCASSLQVYWLTRFYSDNISIHHSLQILGFSARRTLLFYDRYQSRTATFLAVSNSSSGRLV